MARRGGIERVSVHNSRSPGGGWTLRDAIVFPTYILIPFHIIKLGIDQWRITLLGIIFGLSTLVWHLSILSSVLITILIPIIYFSCRFGVLYRKHPSVPTSGVLRGLFYQLRLLHRWKQATRNAKLGNPTPRGGWKPPKIKTLSIASPRGTSVKLRLDLGLTGNVTSELESRTDKILAVLDARSAQVTQIRPGIADFTVHWGIPQSLSTDPWHQSKEQLPIPTLDLDSQKRGQALVRLDTSLLIGGDQGSGKSNTIWAMLARLIQDEIPFKIRVIDPVGGVELDELEHSPFTREYIDNPRNAAQCARKFASDFENRLKWMKAKGIRRHVPTLDQPLEILIIDELLPLKELLSQGVQGPFGEVLATGRKGCFVVWANTQLGQKDVVGPVRDLFQQRICHRTKTDDLTDAVLGTGATQAGAECHRLSLPGEGYVYTDELSTYVEFRTPLIVHTRSIAQGGVPLEEETLERSNSHRKYNGPTFVYQLFDDDQSLTPCYVGIANNPNRRFKEHSRDKVWFSTIIHQMTIIKAYKTRVEAKQTETELIRVMKPKYNVSERSDWK